MCTSSIEVVSMNWYCYVCIIVSYLAICFVVNMKLDFCSCQNQSLRKMTND